ACASDYDGGYGDHLETCSRYRLSGAKAGSEYETCETTKKAADREDAEFDKIDVVPRCPRRVLVAADCVDVPSEASAVQHKRRDTRHTEQDNDRYRDRTDLFLSEDAVPRLKLVDGIDVVPNDEDANGG